VVETVEHCARRVVSRRSVLALMAVGMAKLRGTMNIKEITAFMDELEKIPSKIDKALLL
jgi:glucosamine 6-phosphate synthetase-like amidotransferase/phosphosugar isomerase protein